MGLKVLAPEEFPGKSELLQKAPEPLPAVARGSALAAEEELQKFPLEVNQIFQRAARAQEAAPAQEAARAQQGVTPVR